MTETRNPTFIYSDEEPPAVTAEQVEHMERIFEAPMREAIEITDDELDEDLKEGLG